MVGKGKRKGAKAAKAKAAEAKENREQWKKPRKRKTVVQHRTYEEIMQDAGGDTAAAAGVGVIIDATGATVSYRLVLLARVHSDSPIFRL